MTPLSSSTAGAVGEPPSGVGNFHTSVPVVPCSAYRAPSSEGAYTVPSTPMAGDCEVVPPVRYCHRRKPVAPSTAYTLEPETTTTTPSGPTAIADPMGLPVLKVQVGAMAGPVGPLYGDVPVCRASTPR